MFLILEKKETESIIDGLSEFLLINNLQHFHVRTMAEVLIKCSLSQPNRLFLNSSSYKNTKV